MSESSAGEPAAESFGSLPAPAHPHQAAARPEQAIPLATDDQEDLAAPGPGEDRFVSDAPESDGAGHGERADGGSSDGDSAGGDARDGVADANGDAVAPGGTGTSSARRPRRRRQPGAKSAQVPSELAENLVSGVGCAPDGGSVGVAEPVGRESPVEAGSAPTEAVLAKRTPGEIASTTSPSAPKVGDTRRPPPRPRIGDTRPAPPPGVARTPVPAVGRVAAARPATPAPTTAAAEPPAEQPQTSAAKIGRSRRRSGRERRGRPVGRYLMCVHVRPHATQIAVLEGRILVEHYVSRASDDATQIDGNIYRGRVQNVLPGMEAAFVDIGTPKNAVLYRGDVRYDRDDIETASSSTLRIEQMLKPGQLIVCQVTKNPIGAKGARLTQEVSLPGRFVVMVPDSSAFGISKRLEDTERRRLRR
ncbi:MAG: hypothetical protein ABSH04_06085, partial [Acidimicrobiales bacterium]